MQIDNKKKAEKWECRTQKRECGTQYAMKRKASANQGEEGKTPVTAAGPKVAEGKSSQDREVELETKSDDYKRSKD